MKDEQLKERELMIVQMQKEISDLKGVN